MTAVSTSGALGPPIEAGDPTSGGCCAVVGGAASRRLEVLLAGPVRPAEVRAVFREAVYVDDGDTVVAVVARDAVRLPMSVVVAARSSAAPFARVEVGQPATIGGGRLRAGALEVVVGRWWAPRQAPALARPEHLPGRTRRMASLLLARRRMLADPVAERLGHLFFALRLGHLSAALRRGHPSAGLRPDQTCTNVRDDELVRPAAVSLVGVGEGLTPAGDDVLAGVLLALRQLGRPTSAGRLWDVIGPEVSARTTALSAALLAAAADGDATPQAVGVLAALAGHATMEPALDRLLAVGGTSGCDLAYGLLAGARACTP